MKDLIIDPDAEQELIDILVLHEKRWKSLGINLYLEFQTLFDIIRHDPNSFPQYAGTYRMVVMTRMPFVIFYRDFPTFIWIVAITHPPPIWLLAESTTAARITDGRTQSATEMRTRGAIVRGS
jgi:hypothetical protein